MLLEFRIGRPQERTIDTGSSEALRRSSLATFARLALPTSCVLISMVDWSARNLYAALRVCGAVASALHRQPMNLTLLTHNTSRPQ